MDVFKFTFMSIGRILFSFRTVQELLFSNIIADKGDIFGLEVTLVKEGWETASVWH